jgi:hypothetical protein
MDLAGKPKGTSMTQGEIGVMLNKMMSTGTSTQKYFANLFVVIQS